MLAFLLNFTYRLHAEDDVLTKQSERDQDSYHLGRIWGLLNQPQPGITCPALYHRIRGCKANGIWNKELAVVIKRFESTSTEQSSLSLIAVVGRIAVWNRAFAVPSHRKGRQHEIWDLWLPTAVWALLVEVETTQQW